MFKNVLVGVDGGPTGRDAIALASRLADPAAKLTLAHVRGRATQPLPSFTSGSPIADHEGSQLLLEETRDDSGVEADLVQIVADSPGRGLNEEAEEQKADLLVVGSCSRSAFRRVMLGDDTRGALNGAVCAVAVASVGYAQHSAPISKIGVGYDGSPESEAALRIARELAASTDAKLRALQVVSLPSYSYTGLVPMAAGESIEVMLQEATKRVQGLPGVEAHAAYGMPGEELAAFGADLDILVVGSRSYGPLGRLVHGSTSDYLQRHGRCSLLVLPRASSVDKSADAEIPADDHVALTA